MPELTNAQTLVGTHFGGIGFDGWAWHAQAYKTPAGKTILPPQAATHGSGAFTGDNPYEGALHGTYGVGAGFTGFGLHAGTYDTYRRMRAHPTLTLVRATLVGPILAAGWSIEAGEGDERAKALVESAILPSRSHLLLLLLRALDYGFAVAEIVWDKDKNGMTVPAKVKGLLPEWTSFDSDDKGNLLRVVNGAAKLTMDRVLHYAHDAEGDNPYGRSRNENARRTWTNYLATEDQLFKLLQKAAGIVATMGFPPDNKALAPGELSNQQKVINGLRDLASGRSLAVPTTGGLKIDDVEDAAKMAGKTLFPIDLLNMGDVSGSQAAALDALRYYDQLLCRSWLRSERSAIEAQGGGTRAESSVHTANISDTDCDLIHEEIVGIINRQLVDPMLVENFGPDAAGSVKIKATEIVDENLIVDRKILDGLIRDPLAFGEFLSRLDLAAWCQRNGIRLREGADAWPDEMPTGGQPDGAGAAGERGGEDDPEKEGE